MKHAPTAGNELRRRWDEIALELASLQVQDCDFGFKFESLRAALAEGQVEVDAAREGRGNVIQLPLRNQSAEP